MDLPRNINELKVKLVNINQWWAAKKKSDGDILGTSQSRRASKGGSAKPKTDGMEQFETEKIDIAKKEE